MGQLRAALWNSQSQPDVTQPGFEPGTVVTPLALKEAVPQTAAPLGSIDLHPDVVGLIEIGVSFHHEQFEAVRHRD